MNCNKREYVQHFYTCVRFVTRSEKAQDFLRISMKWARREKIHEMRLNCLAAYIFSVEVTCSMPSYSGSTNRRGSKFSKGFDRDVIKVKYA